MNIETPKTIEARLEYLKSEVDAIFQTSETGELTQFAQGILAGMQQAVSWTLEPSNYAEPLWCVPGLKNIYDAPAS